MEKKKFREIFPNLADELEGGKNTVSLRDSDDEKRESILANRKWVGYDPDIIDFIRRCENEEQVLEIIEYMEKINEISFEKANELRKKLAEGGVRSFGSIKNDDFYHRNVRY